MPGRVMSVKVPSQFSGFGGFDSPGGLLRAPSFLSGHMDPPPQNWAEANMSSTMFPCPSVKTPTRPLCEDDMVGEENFVNAVLDGQKLDDERPKAPSPSVPLLLRECSTRVLSDYDLPLTREDSNTEPVGVMVDQEPESLIDPYNRHLSNNLGFDKALPTAASEELEKQAIQDNDENQIPESVPEAIPIPDLTGEKLPRRNSSACGQLQVDLVPRSKSNGKRRYSEESIEDDLNLDAKRSKKDADSESNSKDKPDMQKWARKGQEHWGKQVRQMRNDWQIKKMWEKDPHFADQIAMCTRAHIKSQHECVLRELQMCKVDGLIHSCKFSDDENDSFLGWKSFRIHYSHHIEFRARIEQLFATVPLENTLNNVFRRAGILPDHCPEEGRTRSWEEAWRGISAFVYVCEKRAVYH